MNSKLNNAIENAVYEFLGTKFRNFVSFVHFFTHKSGIRENGLTPVFFFNLRNDKGAKNFKKEYEEKLKEIRIPLEFDDQKYEIQVEVVCTKEAKS
jgi:hypothetical protein